MNRGLGGITLINKYIYIQTKCLQASLSEETMETKIKQKKGHRGRVKKSK